MLHRRVRLILGHLRSFAAAIFAVSAAGRRVCLLSTSSLLLVGAAIKPGFGIVGLLLGVPSGEESVQILGVTKLLADQHGSVGVALHVLAEIFVILERVVNQAAEEKNVGTCAQRYPDI